jgi:cell wall assembly regulator SMI1
MSLVDFEQWLRKHLPEAAESLNPGATDHELARMGEESAVTLPVQFLDLYRWHNGQQRKCPTGIFYGLRFMPLEEVLKEWRNHASLIEDQGTPAEATGVVKTAMGNERWIPFATDDGGNFLAIDLDPGPRGKNGQVINFGADEVLQYALATDVASFVAWTVSQLRDGNHRIEQEPDGGRSFNTSEPDTAHFLDSARVLFGGAKLSKPAKPADDGPPRDSVPGVLHFMRTELTPQLPAGWRKLRISAQVMNPPGTTARAEFSAEFVSKDASESKSVVPRDRQIIENALVELQARTAEERWNWSKISLEFDPENTSVSMDAE